jgi:hypothetical protein
MTDNKDCLVPHREGLDPINDQSLSSVDPEIDDFWNALVVGAQEVIDADQEWLETCGECLLAQGLQKDSEGMLLGL